jgi:D-aminoacyl-tRNA deacylase
VFPWGEAGLYTHASDVVKLTYKDDYNCISLFVCHVNTLKPRKKSVIPATMRAVIQRVKEASVTVAGAAVGSIHRGILIFLGIGKDDGRDDLDYLVTKIIQLRIFEDEQGKMNRSLLDIQGEALVVSQFTLYGDCRKGRRPSFTDAAAPAGARNLYNEFINGIRQQGIRVATGLFQEMMDVALVNDGPVTFMLDSKKLF